MDNPQGAAVVEHVVDAVLAAGSVLGTLNDHPMRRVAEDVSATQLRLLAALERDPTRSMVELAETLGVDPSSLGRLCDRLVRKGLARRRREVHDRRIVHVRLSDDGRRVLSEATQARRATIRAVAATLDPEQRAAVLSGLHTWSVACRAIGTEQPPWQSIGGLAP